MTKLSTGDASTLGAWLKLTVAIFGDQSAGAKFIREKIVESPNGEDEEVITDERQLLYVIANMQREDKTSANIKVRKEDAERILTEEKEE